MKTIKHIVDIQKEHLMVSVHQEMLQVIKAKEIANVDEIISRSYLYSEGVLEE